MQFYLGSEEPTKVNILSSNEVNDLMKETQLTICDFNKETFNVNEDVELVLEIKNIQTLYANIYEINTENYYYSNKNKFDDNISLDGIAQTYEDIFSYNDKPQLLTEKKISISKLYVVYSNVLYFLRRSEWKIKNNRMETKHPNLIL